jgi:hypothetical protein
VRKEPPQAGGVVGGVREGRRNPATRILPASYSRCTQQQRMEQTGHRTPTKCGSRVVWGPAVRWVLLCGSARELIKVRGAHVASPRLAALHPLSWCARATVTKGLQRTTGTAGLERTAAGSARTLPSPACLSALPRGRPSVLSSISRRHYPSLRTSDGDRRPRRCRRRRRGGQCRLPLTSRPSSPPLTDPGKGVLVACLCFAPGMSRSRLGGHKA